jgi:hypothetical protein
MKTAKIKPTQPTRHVEVRMDKRSLVEQRVRAGKTLKEIQEESGRRWYKLKRQWELLLNRAHRQGDKEFHKMLQLAGDG